MKWSLIFPLFLLVGCAAQKPLFVAVNPTPRASSPAIVSAQSTPKPQVKATPRLPQAWARAIEFSPDARFLAVGTLRDSDPKTGSISVRECATNRVVRSWNAPVGVKSLAFSPDGELMAVIGAYSRLSVWQWKKARLLHSEDLLASNGGRDEIAIKFSPDGRFLSVGILGVQLLNTKNWKRSKPWKTGFDSIVGDLVFSPKGRFLLATDAFDGAAGFSVMALSGRTQHNFPNFGAWSRPVFSRDGQLLTTNGDLLDGNVHLHDYHIACVWNAKTLKIKQFFHSENFQPQSFSPDARQVVGLNVNYENIGTLEIWSVKSGKRVRQFKQTAWRVLWIDAKTLLLGDENGVRRLTL